nr:unnamed protein product [Callosobruchus analis]
MCFLVKPISNSCANKILFTWTGRLNIVQNSFGQPFTIHALCDDVYVPVVFCLLKNKAKSTYLNLLHILKEKCDLMGCVLNPKTVVIDFEIAIHLSVQENTKTSSPLATPFVRSDISSTSRSGRVFCARFYE